MPEAALAGVELGNAGEFAVEIGEEGGMRPERQLAAGLDLRRIARRAGAIEHAPATVLEVDLVGLWQIHAGLHDWQDRMGELHGNRDSSDRGFC